MQRYKQFNIFYIPIIKILTNFIIKKSYRQKIRYNLLKKFVYRPMLDYKKYLIPKNIKLYNFETKNKNCNINLFFDLLNKIQKNNIETFLYYDHCSGGGTESYFHQQVNKLTPKQAIIRIQYLVHEDLYKITIFHNKNFLFLYDLSYPNLHNLIKRIAVKQIFINNLAGYKNLFEVLNYIKSLNCSKIFLCHDYYSICPSITLTDKQGYCNLPEYTICSKCFENNYKKFCNNIVEWRQYWNEFLNACDEIIVFSEICKKIWSKIYPDIANKIIVRPHIVPSLRQVSIQKHTAINIAVMGNIMLFQKGCEVINSLENELQNYDNINLIVLGHYNPKIKETKVIKNYNRNDLPDLIEQNNIDIIFIPSIWPETFCYTAEEAMLMNMPVVCFDIGAHAERIKKYNKGLIINKNINSNEIIKSIINFLK